MAGALGIVFLVPLTALVLDARVSHWALTWKSALLDALVGVINPIGSGATLLVACIVLTLVATGLCRSRLRDAAWQGALAFAASGLLEFTVKHLAGRPRPDAALPAMMLTGPSFAPDVDSFPSGHATSVFAVATVFAVFYPRLRWPLYGLAITIALGRVYLERHYLSDVMAGALIGTVIASLVVRHAGRLGVPTIR